MKRVGNTIKVLDTTCRDGMHAIAHQFTPGQISQLAAALERAGVNYMEVSHGDGLGGSSINYGFGAATDAEWLTAARKELKNTKLAVLFIPGIGTMDDLRMARDCGVDLIRMTVHCTEVDITPQHTRLAKELGMQVFGVLMMSHSVSPEKLLEQAKLFEGYGAEAVYMMDSAGYMMPDQVRERVSALVDGLGIPVGFHAHANLQMHLPNTLAALECGASYTDGTLCGLGAGAGNTPTEVLTPVLERNGYKSSIDLHAIEDAAELLSKMPVFVPPRADKDAITIGYCGIYGSFLLHARKAAERYGVDSRDILYGCAERRAIGGQEDLIIEVAAELARKKAEAAG